MAVIKYGCTPFPALFGGKKAACIGCAGCFWVCRTHLQQYFRYEKAVCTLNNGGAGCFECLLYRVAAVFVFYGADDVAAEQGVHIGFVKGVLLVAEITVHRDAAFFGNGLADFLTAQHQ